MLWLWTIIIGGPTEPAAEPWEPLLQHGEGARAGEEGGGRGLFSMPAVWLLLWQFLLQLLVLRPRHLLPRSGLRGGRRGRGSLAEERVLVWDGTEVPGHQPHHWLLQQPVQQTGPGPGRSLQSELQQLQQLLRGTNSPATTSIPQWSNKSKPR